MDINARIVVGGAIACGVGVGMLIGGVASSTGTLAGIGGGVAIAGVVAIAFGAIRHFSMLLKDAEQKKAEEEFESNKL